MTIESQQKKINKAMDVQGASFYQAPLQQYPKSKIQPLFYSGDKKKKGRSLQSRASVFRWSPSGK